MHGSDGVPVCNLHSASRYACVRPVCAKILHPQTALSELGVNELSAHVRGSLISDMTARMSRSRASGSRGSFIAVKSLDGRVASHGKRLRVNELLRRGSGLYELPQPSAVSAECLLRLNSQCPSSAGDRRAGVACLTCTPQHRAGQCVAVVGHVLLQPVGCCTCARRARHKCERQMAISRWFPAAGAGEWPFAKRQLRLPVQPKASNHCEAAQSSRLLLRPTG
jgi:hypothetical protein